MGLVLSIDNSAIKFAVKQDEAIYRSNYGKQER